MVVPFGAVVEYHPFSPKDRARIHQFGKKVLPAIFLGCELIAERIWKGDTLIADLEDLEKVDETNFISLKNQRKGITDQTKR